MKDGRSTHSRIRRVILAALLAAGGVYLATGPGTGCVSFQVESLLTTADFCFIFDCQNGFFGGTVDPCTGINENTGELPLFSDCPDFNQP